MSHSQTMHCKLSPAQISLLYFRHIYMEPLTGLSPHWHSILNLFKSDPINLTARLTFLPQSAQSPRLEIWVSFLAPSCQSLSPISEIGLLKSAHWFPTMLFLLLLFRSSLVLIYKSATTTQLSVCKISVKTKIIWRQEYKLPCFKGWDICNPTSIGRRKARKIS